MHLLSWKRSEAAKARPFRAVAAALLATSLTLPAPAGGYLSFFGGAVDKWSGTVTVNLDLGGLGTLTNAQADTLALAALTTWDLSTVSLTYAQGADLAADNTGASAPQYGVTGDGISPIVYDTDGTLTDALLGAGANQGVLGFAGPEDFSGNTITEGHAVINGLFIDGAGSPTDVSSTQLQGVIAHELGHMLNLDHAQHNAAFARALTPGSLDPRDFTGFPTMYPLVHDDIDTLANDDIQWISSLYPTAGFTSGTASLEGIIQNSGGTAINGINVVCRQVDDPRNTVVSCVSGYFSGGTTGEFAIPGLTPGEAYVLDVEQIQSGFTGGSRVGPLGSQLSFGSTGLPEFISRAALEGNSDSLSHSSTFIAPTGGTTATLPTLVLNGAPSLSTPVAEVDPGNSISAGNWDDITSDLTTAVMAGEILRISGTVDEGETPTPSDLDFGSGDIEDYYLINANTAAFPLEVFDITVTPTGGAVDLYIISWDAGGGGSLSASGSTTGGSGVPETSDRFWDPSRFGSGGVDGFMLIGIGSDGGAVSYTLDIMATHLDTEDGGAVYVGGVSTNGGQLHVNGTTNSITGQGFSSAGGGPVVTTSDATISVGTVTFVDSQQIDVLLSDGGGYTPGGDVILTVTNAAAGGGAAGDIEMIPTAVPVELSVFQAE